jgi:hypothetical protein
LKYLQLPAAVAVFARLVRADIEKVHPLSVKGQQVLLPCLMVSGNALAAFAVKLEQQQQQLQQQLQLQFAHE